MYRQVKDVSEAPGQYWGEPNPITCMLKSKSLDHFYTIKGQQYVVVYCCFLESAFAACLSADAIQGKNAGDAIS